MDSLKYNWPHERRALYVVISACTENNRQAPFTLKPSSVRRHPTCHFASYLPAHHIAYCYSDQASKHHSIT